MESLQSAPAHAAGFAPRAWLTSFKEAGGNWRVCSGQAQLGFPKISPASLLRMRKLLTDEEAEQVRREILLAPRTRRRVEAAPRSHAR